MQTIETLRLRYRTLELIISEKMTQFTAIDMMRTYQKIIHESIDWHEFSDYLDNLHTKGVLVCIGHTNDGMTKYNLDR